MQYKLNKSKDILLIFLIVLAALLFRRFDAFTHPQLWAEDGTVFLQQFLESGFKSLFIPYAGYLHTLPRLVAYIFGKISVDLLYIPVCYNLTFFVLTVLIAIELWKSAVYLNLRYKILFATVFLFLPIGSEMFMNITNSIWITSLYLVNFIFIGYNYYDKEKWKSLKLLILLVLSLTGPFSLLLSPIIVLIIIIENKKLTNWQLIPLLTILLGGFIQFICIKMISPNVKRIISGNPEHRHLLRFVKYNINELLFVRNGLLPDMPDSVNTVICLLIFALLAYLLIRSYINIKINRKYILLLAPIVFLGSFIAVFWPMEPNVLALACPRYYFVPYTCFAWIFIIGLNDTMRLKDIVVYFVYFLLQSRNMISILPDKQWKKQVLEYKAGIRQEIDINPEGWKVTLPKRK